MESADHLAHVRTAGQRIGKVAAATDLTTGVPSCPGYDLGSLLIHTGGFCRFVRSVLEQRRLPEVDFSDIGTDPVAWHEQEFGALVAALEAEDPSSACWSWGSDQRAAFWLRRAAQELGVHGWDIENAAGAPQPLDPALALDGIDELFTEFGVSHENWALTGAAEQFAGTGETLHLHATDIEDGEFLVRCDPTRFDVRREHAKGDVAVRGTASDLLLFTWGRLETETLEVHGDASILRRWREQVQI